MRTLLSGRSFAGSAWPKVQEMEPSELVDVAGMPEGISVRHVGVEKGWENRYEAVCGVCGHRKAFAVSTRLEIGSDEVGGVVTRLVQRGHECTVLGTA